MSSASVRMKPSDFSGSLLEYASEELQVIQLNWKAEFKDADVERKFKDYHGRAFIISKVCRLNIVGVCYFILEGFCIIFINRGKDDAWTGVFLSILPVLIAVLLLLIHYTVWQTQYPVNITVKTLVDKRIVAQSNTFLIGTCCVYLIVASIDFYIPIIHAPNSTDSLNFFFSGCKLFLYQSIFCVILAGYYLNYLKVGIILALIHGSSFLWGGYNDNFNASDNAKVLSFFAGLYVAELICLCLHSTINYYQNIASRKSFYQMLKIVYINEELQHIDVQANFSVVLRRWIKGEDNKFTKPSWIVDFDEIILEEEIGSGSHGTVYKAMWRQSIVAVKIIHFKSTDGDDLTYLSKELRSLIRMRHPNVVLLMGCCVSPLKIGFIHPYYENKNLQLLLQSRHDLSLKLKIEMMLGLARGINYFHHEGTVHGDIKSLNCLVDTQFGIALSDFGICKIIPRRKKAKRPAKAAPKMNTSDSASLSSHVVSAPPSHGVSAGLSSTSPPRGVLGTGHDEHAADLPPTSKNQVFFRVSAPWLAPELFSVRRFESEISKASDVYAFGIVLWEMCSHQTPYSGLPYQSVPLFVITGGRPTIPAGTPESIASLIQQCWTADPLKRPTMYKIIEVLLTISKSSELLDSVPMTNVNEVTVDDDNSADDYLKSQNQMIDKNELEKVEHFKNGSQGTVYTAKYRGQVVAVKHFENYKNFASVRQSFRREVFIMSRISHPNILKLIGFNFDPNILIIVLRYAERGDLINALQIEDAKTSYEWGLRLKLLIDIAAGLKYLHDQSPLVVHRDIKPENCLVHQNWEAVVSDFGFSAYLQYGALTSSYGTPLYAAPEILSNAEYNESIDVYSFGVLANFMTTLVRPYDDINGDNAWLLKSINSGELRPTMHSSLVVDSICSNKGTHTSAPSQLSASDVDIEMSLVTDPLMGSDETTANRLAGMSETAFVMQWSLCAVSSIGKMCWDQKRDNRPSMGTVHCMLMDIQAILTKFQVTLTPPKLWVETQCKKYSSGE